VALRQAARLVRVAGSVALLALASAAQDGKGQRPIAPPLVRAPLPQADVFHRIAVAIGSPFRSVFQGGGVRSTGGGAACNGTGAPDGLDRGNGTSADCNGNFAPDECDIFAGVSQDCNANGVPDECEPDCDGDGIPDVCDGPDCNGNGLPDNCDVDGA